MFIKECFEDIDDDMGWCQIRYTTQPCECFQSVAEFERKEHGLLLAETGDVEKFTG